MYGKANSMSIEVYQDKYPDSCCHDCEDNVDITLKGIMSKLTIKFECVKNVAN
jgi:hypothetical protein